MKLIVGLGNPESRYAETRHNAGFMAIDRLRDRHAPGASVRAKFNADVIEAPLGGVRCLLVKPMTYMNRSGLAVSQACRFYKIASASEVLVITDDVALPVGAIRLRARGGTGGHNGLADIQRALGTDAYPRCRIGIGAKPAAMDQSDWVLSRFVPEEREDLSRALDRAADAAEVFAAEGVEAAMNRFNTRVTAPPQPEPGTSGDGPGTDEDRHEDPERS